MGAMVHAEEVRMVYWDGQPLEAPQEKGALPVIAAALQSTVSRVMAEQRSGSVRVVNAHLEASSASTIQS